MNAPIEQFRDAIRAAGLNPPDVVIADGELRRFASNGEHGDDAGWYVLHGDGIPAGIFGDWRSGFSQKWRADIGRSLTAAEESQQRERMRTAQQARDAEQVKRRTAAAEFAATHWQSALPAPEDHPYLTRKGISPCSARLYRGELAIGSLPCDSALLVPLRDTAGTLHTLEFIAPNGEKRFLPYGAKRGHYCAIGKPEATLCIVEGFATGASVYAATGLAVAIAFDSGNLEPVARSLRTKYPAAKLIVCADDDRHIDSNPGLTKATAAARAVGGFVAVPDFGPDRPEGATDFNDLAQHQGPEAIQLAIANATPSTVTLNAQAHDLGGYEWPEPQPLTTKVSPEPYPIGALPDSIRAAVEEVAGFVKAPLPLVASSALAALSLAIQAHADAKRAEKLVGPVGLFLLTIADSGERKSTCDGFFTQAIRDYEVAQAEAAKPILKNHMAANEAWEAKRGGIKEKIRQLAKAGKATGAQESELRDLEKPECPRFPRLLYTDATPEALAYGLAKQWPSAGVVSAEAGIVFGSHAMGKDSIMRNLGLLNQLWDGTGLTIDRRSTESFTVRGARLTVALQVQEPTLRRFFDRSGGLARGTGFLARFLLAWPESTQGFRPFTEPPANWPHLAAFNRRITAILDQPAPIHEDGALTPPLLPLTPDAKAAWVAFHDEIESKLASGGELYDVRDVASKCADNAVRLAALFQAFAGSASAIEADAFGSASVIAAWHLNESRRFLGELALPTELTNAARLDTWLIEHCRRERTHRVPTQKVQQFGPCGLREKAAFTTAMRELKEAGRARLVAEGKRRFIRVNPALLSEGGES